MNHQNRPTPKFNNTVILRTHTGAKLAYLEPNGQSMQKLVEDGYPRDFFQYYL